MINRTFPLPSRSAAYGVPAVAMAASLLLTGCAGDAPAALDGGTRPAATERGGSPVARASLEVAPRQLPGLGPTTLGKIPAETRQAVVVTGHAKDSPLSTVVLYERTEAGWQAVASWPADNGLKGWSDHHKAGDLRSPIGVYSLTDAGGRLANPGTRLSYDRSTSFTAVGTGFQGESLAGSFDYVIAIDYNRKRGSTPLDWTRPLGEDLGGGIWLHVDHGGPTHGCVSLHRNAMKSLLRTLDPGRHPMVVMGDAASLKR